MKKGIFKDAEICNKSRDIYYLLLRDLEEIIKFIPDINIMINKFVQIITEYEKLTRDQANLNIVMELVERKRVQIEELKLIMKRIILRIEIQYSDTDMNFVDNFKIKNISQLHNVRFYDALTKFHSICKQNIEKLNSAHISNDELAVFYLKFQQFVENYTAVDIEKKTRKNSTQIRTQKYNELYACLVQMSKIGKMVWANNPTFYNHYILYEGKYKPRKKNKPVEEDIEVVG